MTTYTVRFINAEKNLDVAIAVPEDQYILDMAEEAGIRLPSGCLQGECSVCVAKLLKCSVCVAKLLSGNVEQREQKFLKPSEIAEGYTVTCVAYPRSDCVLETHQESVLYQSSLYYSPPSS